MKGRHMDVACLPRRGRIRGWVNRERGRYYITVVTDDLFGGLNLQRFWGQCDSRCGGQMAQHFDESQGQGPALPGAPRTHPELIEKQLHLIALRRRQRGYVEGP